MKAVYVREEREMVRQIVFGEVGGHLKSLLTRIGRPSSSVSFSASIAP
jgi:hypothetical protein